MSVVVIGNFDGVHRGHQAVLRQARALAQAEGTSCTVLTFDPHPSQILGRPIPPRLVSLSRRVELLLRHGADDVVVEPFTVEFSNKRPEEFVIDLLIARLRARVVVVGEDFRFGKLRAGDRDTLETLGRRFGFHSATAQVAGDARGAFSSTRVRSAIAKGDVDESARVLGRWHALTGRVEKGDRLARTINAPTANLGNIVEMLPQHGVYAAVVDEVNPHGVARSLAKAVVHVGSRPTVRGTAVRAEAHLIDWDGELYGETLRVHLVQHLRDVRSFSGLEALREQIGLDIAQARAITADLEPAGPAYG